eukprot:Pgem_evm2s7419
MVPVPVQKILIPKLESTTTNTHNNTRAEDILLHESKMCNINDDLMKDIFYVTVYYSLLLN